MPIAREYVPPDISQTLTDLCRFSQLRNFYDQALKSPDAVKDIGSLAVDDRDWQTSLSIIRGNQTLSRTLRLESDADVFKLRAHAYPMSSSNTDLPVVWNEGGLEWLDSYPLLRKVKAVHKTAGHVAVYSAAVIFEGNPVELMTLESGSSVTIEDTYGLVRKVGGALLALPVPDVIEDTISERSRYC